MLRALAVLNVGVVGAPEVYRVRNESIERSLGRGVAVGGAVGRVRAVTNGPAPLPSCWDVVLLQNAYLVRVFHSLGLDFFVVDLVTDLHAHSVFLGQIGRGQLAETPEGGGGSALEPTFVAGQEIVDKVRLHATRLELPVGTLETLELPLEERQNGSTEIVILFRVVHAQVEQDQVQGLDPGHVQSFEALFTVTHAEGTAELEEPVPAQHLRRARP